MRILPERSAHRPSDDPIFALNREALERRAAGESIINATVGAMLDDDGALSLLPSVIEAVRAVPGDKSSAYAPIGGHPAFLQAVTDDLLGGTPLHGQAVAVATPGGTGAVRHAVATFLERGQALVTTSFYWGPYATICDEHERTLRTFPMFDPEGRFHVAALERTLAEVSESQGRLLVLFNDPCHNPTGYSISDREWADTAAVLSRAASRVPLVVLVDIAYLAFARDRQLGCLRHLSPLAEQGLLLLAWSASKSHLSYGQRVGALVACTADAAEREAVKNALAYACRATWSNCNSGGQLAIARCIAEGPLRARVEGERDRLRSLLQARVDAFNRAARGRGLRFPRYDGGFFVTLFADQAEATAERLKRSGVFVVPQQGALRVALCSVREADVPRLVDALAEAVG